MTEPIRTLILEDNPADAELVQLRSCPDTPFILVTSAVTEDRAIDILTQGAKDYVLKNRLQQRLAPAVRRALAEVEEHRARKQADAELREAHRTLSFLEAVHKESFQAFRQHFLYLRPLPQGQGSLRPAAGCALTSAS